MRAVRLIARQGKPRPLGGSLARGERMFFNTKRIQLLTITPYLMDDDQAAGR